MTITLYGISLDPGPVAPFQRDRRPSGNATVLYYRTIWGGSPGNGKSTLILGTILLLVNVTVVQRGVEKRQLPLVQIHSGSLVETLSVPSLMNVMPLLFTLRTCQR